MARQSDIYTLNSLVFTQKSTSFRPIFGGDTWLYTVRRLGGVCSCPARLRNSYGLVAFLYVVGGNGCLIISIISRQQHAKSSPNLCRPKLQDGSKPRHARSNQTRAPVCKQSPLLVRLRKDLYCVGWGLKLYSLTHSLTQPIIGRHQLKTVVQSGSTG